MFTGREREISVENDSTPDETNTPRMQDLFTDEECMQSFYPRCCCLCCCGMPVVMIFLLLIGVINSKDFNSTDTACFSIFGGLAVALSILGAAIGACGTNKFFSNNPPVFKRIASNVFGFFDKKVSSGTGKNSKLSAEPKEKQTPDLKKELASIQCRREQDVKVLSNIENQYRLLQFLSEFTKNKRKSQDAALEEDEKKQDVNVDMEIDIEEVLEEHMPSVFARGLV